MSGTWPSELPGMDLQEGLERFSGNWQLYVKMMHLFIKNHEWLGDELKALLESMDCESVVTLAHKVKGAAANLSATDLKARAKELEDAGNNRDLDAVRVGIVALKESFDSLAKTIGALAGR